ncbi:hypothetical protein T08_15412 [Trichinella sp. T8]|nr:hypothetical protein T08_15412 [Trichinella sp. T8]
MLFNNFISTFNRLLFISTRSSWQLKNSRGLIVCRHLSQRNAGTVVGFVRPQVNAALFALDSGQVLYVGTDRKRPASIVKNASTSTRQADAKTQTSIVQSKLLLTNHRPPGRKPKSVIRFPWHLSN